jgi:hypothetical protein
VWSRAIRRLAWLAPTLLLSAARADVAVPGAPHKAEVRPDPGQYRIFGKIRSDTCNGQIVLAARTLTIGADRKSVHADVVNRDYQAAFDGQALVATGRFRVPVCGGSTLRERWELRPAVEALAGTLKSEWAEPSDCSRRCVVVFDLQLVPASSAAR